MVARMQEKPNKAEGEGDVSNCVHNLIEAFTNGLNIFKRLRESRKKRKARKQNQISEPVNSAELQLQNSLRKGPQDLAERYEECYGQKGMGDRFARGDSIAHASLAEILIRLNTGLVGIITAFLHHDRKDTHNHMNLNYRSLTDLSEAARQDALQSMSELYKRLSHSQLQIHPALRSKPPQCYESSDSNSSSSKGKKKSAASRRPNGSHVTRMPIKSSSQPQLCVVRSKSRNTSRKDSVASGSFSTSKSNSKLSSPYSSPYTSPLQSPVPEYAALDPMIHERLDFKNAAYARGAYVSPIPPPSKGHKRIDSLDVVRPVAWSPYAQPYDYFSYMSEHVHAAVPKLPDFRSTPRVATATPALHKTPAVPAKPLSLTSTNNTLPGPAPMKRRLEKVTLSSYTFASDSTKLGEIPESSQARPWDYEQAEMLNNMAAAAGKVNVTAVAEDKKGKEKKGLRFWKRGETA